MTTTLTDSAQSRAWIGSVRLFAQGLVGRQSANPLGAVARAFALQAQDYAAARESIALRTAETTDADVTAALDAGEIVRSWPMRGTLHFVAAAELGWLTALCGPRGAAATERVLARNGVNSADIAHTRAAVATKFTAQPRLTRANVVAAIESSGISVTANIGAQVIVLLAARGELCLGPTDGKQQLFVQPGAWLPTTNPVEPDEALAHLARRYVLSHGPVTDADLARWTGLTLASVRAGLSEVRDEFETVSLGGSTYFVDAEAIDAYERHATEVDVDLWLPAFDEYVLGYADRSIIVDPQFVTRLSPASNGQFLPVLVRGGRVLATWKRDKSGARQLLDVFPAEP